jgi:hypothetical protein
LIVGSAKERERGGVESACATVSNRVCQRVVVSESIAAAVAATGAEGKMNIVETGGIGNVTILEFCDRGIRKGTRYRIDSECQQIQVQGGIDIDILISNMFRICQIESGEGQGDFISDRIRGRHLQPRTWGVRRHGIIAEEGIE